MRLAKHIPATPFIEDAHLRAYDKAEFLAAEMLQWRQPPGNVRHMFFPGLYVRELTMQAGSLAIGRIHKTPHINVLVEGAVKMVKDGETTILRAPLTFLSPPGRNIGFVLEKMVWLNLYPTDLRDVEAIEEMHLESSSALDEAKSRILMLPWDSDFEKMCADLGETPEQMRELSERTDDLIPWPLGQYKVKIGKSYIEGRGLICTSDLGENEFICPAIMDGKRTPAARYANHSSTPNAVARAVGNNIYLLATKEIGGCRGGFDGEEITIDYRQARGAIVELLK